MKILAIATICPVPGILAENDVILQFYKHLQVMYPEVEVKVLKPVVFVADWMLKARPDLKALCEARKLGRFEVHGFPVQLVPFFHISNKSHIYHTMAKAILLTNKRRIAEFLDGYDYDFIHAHYINMDGELARQLSRQSGKPYVLSTQREIYRFRNKVEQKNVKRIVECAAAVTSLSPFAAERISQYSDSCSRVIPYGIEDMFFDNENIPGRPISTKIRLIAVCRLMKLKNIDIILLALARMKESFDFEFSIIGDGSERQKLELLTEELELSDHVTFRGYLSREVICLELLQHDLFVLPSAPETYGLVYPEALACGLPIVCAKDNGFHGHFKEGDCGYSVSAESVDELEKVLAHLLSEPDEIRRMSVRAIEHAQNFKWQGCCDAYMTIFRNL